MSECLHPEEDREFSAGNWVPPYGWEQWPGLYCLQCGEMLDEGEYGYPEDDGDEIRDRRLEDA